jgi:fatty acid desaturase
MILRYSADWRSLMVIALTLTAAFLVWSGACAHPLLWCASIGLMYICFSVNHNHQHVQMSRYRWLNRIIDFALTLCQGLPATVIVYAHNIDHHTHCDSPEDAMWTGHVRTRNHLARLFFYPGVAAWRYRLVRKKVATATKVKNPAFARRVVVQQIFLATAVATMLFFKPLATLMVFIIPWALVHLWGLNSNFMQHEACEHTHADNHSRNFVGRFFNWMLFNGGYHTIHHERPSLHWSLIPRAHDARADRIAPHLNIRFWAWWMVLYAVAPKRALKGTA